MPALALRPLAARLGWAVVLGLLALVSLVLAPLMLVPLVLIAAIVASRKRSDAASIEGADVRELVIYRHPGGWRAVVTTRDNRDLTINAGTFGAALDGVRRKVG
jgi:hypothetical protein